MLNGSKEIFSDLFLLFEFDNEKIWKILFWQLPLGRGAHFYFCTKREREIFLETKTIKKINFKYKNQARERRNGTADYQLMAVQSYLNALLKLAYGKVSIARGYRSGVAVEYARQFLPPFPVNQINGVAPAKYSDWPNGNSI